MGVTILSFIGLVKEGRTKPKGSKKHAPGARYVSRGRRSLRQDESGDVFVLNSLALVSLCAFYCRITQLSNFVGERIDHSS